MPFPGYRRSWVALATLTVLVISAFVTGCGPADQSTAAVSPETIAETPDNVSPQSDGTNEQTDLPPLPPKKPPQYPNLDSNLNRLAEVASSTLTPAGTDMAPSNQDDEPVLVTFYIEEGHVDDVREYLEENDIFVRNVGEDYIEAHVPHDLLAEASQRSGVVRVDTVILPRPASRGNVISQGVALHGAGAWHRAGITGQSVKVGIIDLGFEGFSQLQGTELPRNVTARCYFETARAPSSRLADCEVGNSHGTAVAETLIDIAPDVELFIARTQTWGDLQGAANWMAHQGVRVINMSVQWIPDGPGDGTGYFSNSPLRTVDTAVSSGITWVNAGGNNAGRVWFGRLRDSDGDGWHEFDTPYESNNFDVKAGEGVRAFMRWEDTWGRADCDLDLALLRWLPGSDTPQIVDLDTTWQNGSVGSIPRAFVSIDEVSFLRAGRYSLAIFMQNCAVRPSWIQLTAWIEDDLQYYSDGYHSGSPDESRNPGMLAVAATHYWDTNTIASYSSRGPTIDGRTKPDITGIHCAEVASYPRSVSTSGRVYWFCGTSQSSSHVAGLAALVKQQSPNYTPAQVASYMKQNAADRGAAGADTTWGYGFARLPAPQVAPTPIPLPTPVPTPVSGRIVPTANVDVRAGANPGEVIVSWDAVPSATHYRIGYVNMEVDYYLATASCTGEWIEAFVYVDVNAQNIPVTYGRAEYTVRRLAPGVRHAFTVLTSNNFADTGGGGSVSSEFFWPSNPRWTFLPGRAGSELPSRCHSSN